MKTKIGKYLIIFILLLVFLGGISIYQKAYFNDGKLHVVFCDVGQGDAIYIRTPCGKDILIDGGPDEKVLTCLANNMPFWDRKLELVILTHPHADHLTGLISVLDRYSLMYYASEKVENKGILPKKLQDKLALKKMTANYLKKGDRIVFSDKTEIRIFWPDKNALENYIMASKSANFDLDANSLSLVQLLSYGSFKLLLTGDADKSVLEKIGEEIGDVDVLQVAHHGSKTGTSSKLLAEITPELAVISVGKENKYGHPADEVLSLLKKEGVKVLRTDMDSEVKIVSDGKSY